MYQENKISMTMNDLDEELELRKNKEYNQEFDQEINLDRELQKQRARERYQQRDLELQQEEDSYAHMNMLEKIKEYSQMLNAAVIYI
jgi:hypothetical protein